MVQALQKLPDLDPKAIERVRHWGYWVLLMSWLPLVGDALCLAAGWLRFNPWLSLAAFAVGKLARYLFVAGAWIGLTS